MQKQEYTITVYTENQVGLLNRIAIIFSRRKLNIESFNSSPSEMASITSLMQRLRQYFPEWYVSVGQI